MGWDGTETKGEKKRKGKERKEQKEEKKIPWVASCIVFSVTPDLEQANTGNKLSARSTPKLCCKR